MLFSFLSYDNDNYIVDYMIDYVIDYIVVNFFNFVLIKIIKIKYENNKSK